MQFTLVTVTFREEVHSLALQARSIRKYLSSENLSRIYVVVNEGDIAEFSGLFNRHVLPEYEGLRDLVHVVSLGDILPGLPSLIDGWITQQALKLAMADRVETPLYVALDTKNHFIRPHGLSSYLDGDGRMKMCRQSFSAPLESGYVGSFEYFGLNPDDYRERHLPQVTPYVFHTDTVRGLSRHICEAENVPHIGMFMARRRKTVTEFFLYCAYVHKTLGTEDSLYTEIPNPALVVWSRSPETPGSIEMLLKRSQDEDIGVFSVHRNAGRKLSQEQATLLAQFWLERGLIGDRAEADLFLGNQPFPGDSLPGAQDRKGGNEPGA